MNTLREKELIFIRSISIVREELYKEITSESLSFADFSEKSNIRRSTLSLVFNQDMPMALPFAQLIKITKALGHKEDHFFTFYIDECFVEKKASKSRLIPFLNKCIELDRQDCIADILHRLDSNFQERYLQSIFDVCVTFLHTKQLEQAKEFFNWLAKHEKDLSSERSCITRYGLFRLDLSQDDNEQNLRNAIQFTPFLYGLPAPLQLDALLQLTNVYFNLAIWGEMEFYADRLRELAHPLSTGDFLNSKYSTERHAVVYYGQGFLQKGNALEHLERYDESYLYISGYEDLSWFPSLDEVGWIEVDKFKRWAKANRFNLAVLQGNFSPLEAYVFFLEQHPHEVLPSLITILESANRYFFSIDRVLEKFLPWITVKIEGNYYSELFNRNRLVSLYSLIAQYHLKRGRPELADFFSSQALELSKSLNNIRHFRMLASLSADRFCQNNHTPLIES